MTTVSNELGNIHLKFIFYENTESSFYLKCIFSNLESKGIDLQPIFITIDPDRDTRDVVGKYVKEFSSKIVGLTGTVDEIKNVCHAFNVYFKAGPKDKSEDYIVSHSSKTKSTTTNDNELSSYVNSN